jgi:protein gp37
MAEKSIIAWTNNTFNPAMGCVKVSDGCKNCYAERLTRDRMGLSLWGKNGVRQITSASNWKKPAQWNQEAEETGQRKLVFCASLCDVFEDHPTIDGMRPRLWEMIRETPWLDWQLLTKRPERIGDHLPEDWGTEGWPNVWLGTSVEDMRVAVRADYLRYIPATVRFISYEPALGPLDDLDLTGIDWVIYGGESGPGFRNHDLSWPRAMNQKCLESGAAFFFKQSPAYRTEMGTTLDGRMVRMFPTPRLETVGTNRREFNPQGEIIFA